MRGTAGTDRSPEPTPDEAPAETSGGPRRRARGALADCALVACALTGVALIGVDPDLETPGLRTPDQGNPAPAGLRHAEGPPPGHTGGFGEPTCRACHADFPLGIDGSLAIDGLPRRYETGETYLVTIVLASEGMELGGFQAAFRYAGGERVGGVAGRVEAVDSTVVVAVGDGGTYVQHAPGGTWGSEVVSWTFRWTAPAKATDEAVVVHAAANSANGDDSPSGDIVYAAERTMRVGATSPSAPGVR